MEFITNFVNIKTTHATQNTGDHKMNDKVLERIKLANIQMNKQLAAAQKAAKEITEEKALSDAQLSSMQDQLSNAKKTISVLEQKVRDLTKSLEESLSKMGRKEKKADYSYTKKLADTVPPESEIKISVN